MNYLRKIMILLIKKWKKQQNKIKTLHEKSSTTTPTSSESIYRKNIDKKDSLSTYKSNNRKTKKKKIKKDKGFSIKLISMHINS